MCHPTDPRGVAALAYVLDSGQPELRPYLLQRFTSLSRNPLLPLLVIELFVLKLVR